MLFKMYIKIKLMSNKIFDNNLVAIRKSKLALKLNKPSYIGMCILELSNILMYQFYYDYIKNIYGSNSRLFFTDTDSLMYEIKTEDVYEDFSSNKEMFDFSIIPVSQKLWWCKQISHWKNERWNQRFCNWRICWIEAKKYSLFVDTNDHKKQSVWIKMLLQK